MAKENQEIEHVEAIAVTQNALEQIERASIDIQIATAKKYPRSMDKFYKRAEAMVTVDKATASSCLYSRPVGKEGGKMKYAEGESIRLAEIVASCFGNIRVAGRITEMEPRHVKAQGVAFDLETNTAYTAEVVESTVTRHGVPFSERMRVVVSKAAQSKAIRDAIFRIVPKSLCKPLAEKAKIVAMGDSKTFKDRRKNVVEWIKSLKIEPARVWAAIGIEGEEDIDKNILVLLAGIKTALEEGDCTINEAFPKPEAEQKGSTAERIKDHYDDPDKKVDEPKTEPEKEKPTEKPPRKPRSDKSKKRNQKSEQAEETPPETAQEQEPTSAPPPEPETEQKEEPTLVKCPQCSQEVDPAKDHDCKPVPGTEEDKEVWKCLRCDRKLKDNDKDIQNGLCGYCMGQVARL